MKIYLVCDYDRSTCETTIYGAFSSEINANEWCKDNWGDVEEYILDDLINE